MYYKSSDASHGTEQGFIDLSGEWTVSYDESISAVEFRIYTITRTWHLQAERDEEARFWVAGLIHFQKQKNGFKPAPFRGKTSDPFGQKIMSSNRTNSNLIPSEDLVQLEDMLQEAESELQIKKTRIDELNRDLQNSILIIKAKGEQIDRLQQRLDQREETVRTLEQNNSRLETQLKETRQQLSELQSQQSSSSSPCPSDSASDLSHPSEDSSANEGSSKQHPSNPSNSAEEALRALLQALKVEHQKHKSHHDESNSQDSPSSSSSSNLLKLLELAEEFSSKETPSFEELSHRINASNV
jgi:DNA repair exonuclease SbcCD ATPase subunit